MGMYNGKNWVNRRDVGQALGILLRNEFSLIYILFII